MAGGQALGGGLADMQKKRQEAEAQAAGSMIQFQTLKQAKLLTPEEETDFLNGNANKRNAIVTAATPRLAQFFQTQRERKAAMEHQLNRDVQMQIAQMHYGANGVGPNTPQVDPKTGFIWNGREWVKPPASAIDPWKKVIPIARGTLKNGEFYNNYAGAENGDQVQLAHPDGKTSVMPWKSYEANVAPQQSSPSAPSAASGAAPVTPSTAIIEKGGHHYEVDHATKRVLRQID